MEDQERKQFEALSESAFAAVPELRDTLLEEVNRLGPARDDLADVLDSGAKQAQSSVAKSLYEGAQTAQGTLFEGTLTVVADPLERLMGQMEAKPAPAETDLAPAIDLATAIDQLQESQLGLETAKLFFGFTLILLHGSVASYIDTCEEFLGWKIGSHNARGRAWKVAKVALGSAFDTAPGLIFPPAAIPFAFRTSLTEAYRQLKTGPRDVSKKTQEATAAGIDRLAVLTQTAERHNQDRPLLEQYLAISVNAIIEERQAISETMRQLRPLLGEDASGGDAGSSAD